MPVANGDTTLDVVVTGDGFVEAVAARFVGDAEGIDAIPAFIDQAAGGDLTAVAAAIAREPRSTRIARTACTTRSAAPRTSRAPRSTPSKACRSSSTSWPASTATATRLLEICAAMGLADVGGTVRDAATSDIPVLTVSGEFDPFTPATFADDVRGTLSHSFGLEFPGVGQGVLLSAACPAEVVAAFIADPGQEPDASCIAEMPEFGTTGATPSAEPSTTPDTSPGPDATPRPDKTPKPAKPPKARPVQVGLVKVAEGFENANGINNAGDKRLFVTEQEGYVEVLKPNKDGTFRDAGKFLDIREPGRLLWREGLPGHRVPARLRRDRLLLRHVRGHRPHLEPGGAAGLGRTIRTGPIRTTSAGSSGSTSRSTTTGPATCTSAPTATCT